MSIFLPLGSIGRPQQQSELPPAPAWSDLHGYTPPHNIFGTAPQHRTADRTPQPETPPGTQSTSRGIFSTAAPTHPPPKQNHRSADLADNHLVAVARAFVRCVAQGDAKMAEVYMTALRRIGERRAQSNSTAACNGAAARHGSSA